MSLLRTRRERSAGGGKPTPPSVWKQLLLLAVILAMIWYLSQFA